MTKYYKIGISFLITACFCYMANTMSDIHTRNSSFSNNISAPRPVKTEISDIFSVVHLLALPSQTLTIDSLLEYSGNTFSGQHSCRFFSLFIRPAAYSLCFNLFTQVKRYGRLIDAGLSVKQIIFPFNYFW